MSMRPSVQRILDHIADLAPGVTQHSTHRHTMVARLRIRISQIATEIEKLPDEAREDLRAHAIKKLVES